MVTCPSLYLSEKKVNHLALIPMVKTISYYILFFVLHIIVRSFKKFLKNPYISGKVEWMRIRIYPYADPAISGSASRAARLFFYSVVCLKNGEVEKIIRNKLCFL